MKHGKKHRAEVAKSLPEWRHEFMSYRALKREVKLINPIHFNSNGKKRSGSWATEGMGFALLLARELDKINAFYIDKEEDCIIGFRVSC